MGERQGTNRQGWAAVFILFAAYAVAFVDRQIIGLLVDPIKADLGIGDTGIGMLQGPAFGLFYTLLGLPLGWLADRVHRVRLIAVGISLWSLMTIFCGLATSFDALFMARMGVGVGEAVLVPAAISLLADFFPPDRRALPMSIFTSGLSLGAGMALLLGSGFIGFAAHGAAALPLVGPLLAPFASWQVAFCLAGGLGVPVVIAILLLREPPRGREQPDRSSAQDQSAFRYIFRSWRLFVPLLAGSSLLYLFSNALAAWMPSIFIRQYGWLAADVGLRLGLLIMGCAITGNLLSGLCATWLARRGAADASLRMMLAGSVLMMPAAALACFAGSAKIAMIGFMGLYLGVALCFGIATTAFVTVAPAMLRGRIVAIYLLLGNLLGLGLGPPSVGWLVDHILRDPRQVGMGLAIVAALTLLPGFLLLLAARRPFIARSLAINAE